MHPKPLANNMKENEKDTKQTQEEAVTIEKEKLTENGSEGKTKECPEGKTENRSEGKTENRSEGQTESNPEGHTENQAQSKTEGHTESQAQSKKESKTECQAEDNLEGQLDTPAPPSLDELTEKACTALKGNEEINEREIGSITQFLHSMISDIQAGEMSKETIDTLLLALHHDADVENALREGEVKGRNAKIDEWKEQRRGMAGVHQLGNAASGGLAHVPQARLGGLCAADRQTIWERGKEKRVRY